MARRHSEDPVEYGPARYEMARDAERRRELKRQARKMCRQMIEDEDVAMEVNDVYEDLLRAEGLAVFADDEEENSDEDE